MSTSGETRSRGGERSIIALARRTIDCLERVSYDTLVSTPARLFLATTFLLSGRTKVEGFLSVSASAFYLFEYEYSLLRVNGLAYKDLEEAGIFFVVAELNIKFRRPSFYDQALTLKTTSVEVTASRARHTYELSDKATKQMSAEGQSVLACVDAEGKLRRMPSFMYVDSP